MCHLISYWVLYSNPVMNLLLGHTYIPLSSAPVALQRRIPGADGGDEQAEAEQGTDCCRSLLLFYLSQQHVVAFPKGRRWLCRLGQEFTAYRKERGKMLMSRKNQLLLEFSFWNEPVPREGPNIYELRSYQLRVSDSPSHSRHSFPSH